MRDDLGQLCISEGRGGRDVQDDARLSSQTKERQEEELTGQLDVLSYHCRLYLVVGVRRYGNCRPLKIDRPTQLRDVLVKRLALTLDSIVDNQR